MTGRADAMPRIPLLGPDEVDGSARRIFGALTRTSAAPDSHFTELSMHWSYAAVVEITVVAALLNLFNRFAGSLEIPVTR